MKFYIVGIVGAILICCISCTHIYKYKTFFRNNDIFSPCENQPENVLDINGLFDLSNLHMDFDENEDVILSGNVTTIWDIQPSDVILLSFSLLRFDRGSWVPTQYSVKVPSFCSVLHTKNDFWYDAWMKHVINAEQIKNKCLQPGTQFVHKTYPVNLLFNSQNNDLNGYFKILGKMHAIGIPNKVRPTSICFEIRGDIEMQ